MANKRFIIISEVPLSNKIYKDWFVGHLIKIFKSKFEFWIINKNIKLNKDPFKINKKYVKKLRLILNLTKNRHI